MVLVILPVHETFEAVLVEDVDALLPHDLEWETDFPLLKDRPDTFEVLDVPFLSVSLFFAILSPIKPASSLPVATRIQW